MGDATGADAVGTIIELTPTTVAHGGEFVARHEGRVVFVRDALIGERVLARVSNDSKKAFWRADAVEVLDPSPHRQAHVWEEAAISREPQQRAGGAEFGHIALDYQRELKRQIIAEALSRMADYDFGGVVEAAPGDDATGGRGWRTRMRAHVDDDGMVGPFAARSKTVLPVSSYPLASPEVSAAVPRRAPSSVEHIDIVESDDAITVVPHNRRRKGSKPAHTIVERVGQHEFRLDATGFWQVHREAPQLLSEAVCDAIENTDRFDPAATNMDLYGGVGLFSAAIANRFVTATHIVSVEDDRTAHEHAKSNLARWPEIASVPARVDQYLRTLLDGESRKDRTLFESGTVVVDPPRAGLGSTVVEQLGRLRPSCIVYVSCDPVTFARDVALLTAQGFTLSQVRAFDLFPHTSHVELLGTFTC